LTAFASSLDHIGPFARNVKDAATVLRVMAGRDLRDATSADAPVPDYCAQLNGDVKGLKLGLPRVSKRFDERNRRSHREGCGTVRALGCEVREISLPATDYAIATYYIIATARPARTWRVTMAALHVPIGCVRHAHRHVCNTRGEGSARSASGASCLEPTF